MQFDYIRIVVGENESLKLYEKQKVKALSFLALTLGKVKVKIIDPESEIIDDLICWIREGKNAMSDMLLIDRL